MILVVLTLQSVKTLNVTFSRFHNFTFRGAQGWFFLVGRQNFFLCPARKNSLPRENLLPLKVAKIPQI